MTPAAEPRAKVVQRHIGPASTHHGRPDVFRPCGSSPLVAEAQTHGTNRACGQALDYQHDHLERQRRELSGVARRRFGGRRDVRH